MQIFIACLVAIILGGGIFLYARFDLRRLPIASVPSDQERSRQAKLLVSETLAVPGNEPKTAAKIKEQTKVAFDRIAADRTALESRAATLVGLAAAATGASAFLSGEKGITVTPLIVAAAPFALVSLISLLFVLRSKRMPQPNPATLVFDRTVWDEDMGFRIYLSLAEQYIAGAVDLLNGMRTDRIATFVGTSSLAAATAIVVANALFPGPKVSDSANCVITTSKGNAIVKVECHK